MNPGGASHDRARHRTLSSAARVHFRGRGRQLHVRAWPLLLKSGRVIRSPAPDRTRSHKTEASGEGRAFPIAHRPPTPKTCTARTLIVYTAAASARKTPNEPGARKALGIPPIGALRAHRPADAGQPVSPWALAVPTERPPPPPCWRRIFLAAGRRPHHPYRRRAGFHRRQPRAWAQGDDFLCEACEFNASFLQFHPTVAVILNIDEDHLDFYRQHRQH